MFELLLLIGGIWLAIVLLLALVSAGHDHFSK